LAGVEPYVPEILGDGVPLLTAEKEQIGNKRVYIRKDLELVLQIKKLLYEDRFYHRRGEKKKFGEIEPP